MTANVNIEEVRVQKLSIYEAEEGTKLFNLTLGQILRNNDVNSYKADKKGVSKDITKEDYTLTHRIPRVKVRYLHWRNKCGSLGFFITQSQKIANHIYRSI